MDCKNCEKLKSDLLIAQAAIAAAKSEFKASGLGELLVTSDLSALDKRDREQQRFGREEGRQDEREKRKPLVDALERLIKEYWMNKGTEHEFIVCTTSSGIPMHWCKADDALAKVKEKP